MRERTDTSRHPEDVEHCRKVLAGLNPKAIAEALEVEGDFKARRHHDMRACLQRLFDAGVSSSVVAGALGVTTGVVQSHWRNMGLSSRVRPIADLPGEVWKRVPGWKLEVSNLARVRTLAGRLIVATIEKGKPRVRYTGSDADPTEKRMFTLASLVLAAFAGEPFERTARHLDGNTLNCRPENLAPDKLIYHRSQGPTYMVDPDPAAVAQCRCILSETSIPVSVVEAFLTHRGDRNRQQWRDAETCIRALVAADVSSRTIAGAMGVLVRVVTARREKLGIGAAPLVEPDRRPGEKWRRVPGYRAKVSTLGRVTGARGALLAGKMKHGRPRVRLEPDGSGKPTTVTLASVVLGTWKGLPIDAPAKHRDGDVRNCRLSNLEPGVQGYRPDARRADRPWTRREDLLLKKATSYAEAASLTGHTVAYARKRMQLLGIELQMPTGSRRGVTAPLEFRNFSALEQCVAVLQDAGVEERTINLGLNIIKQDKGEFALKCEAVNHCISTLHAAGVPHRKIREAVGLVTITYHRHLHALGIKTPPNRPKGWLTMSGPIDHRDGEEWRQIPGLSHLVSSEGRVATEDGWLISPHINRRGTRQVCLVRNGRRTYTVLVQRLVVMAFKPEMSTRLVRHLNGDLLDDRVTNLIPSFIPKTEVAETVVTRRTGNVSDTAGPARGSIPRGEPLWAQADAIVPRGMEDDVRADLVSEMVMLVMDGRARTMAEAFGKARTAYNRMMGVWSEVSLDTPLGDDGGATRIDMLTSDSEFVDTGQVRARRS